VRYRPPLYLRLILTVLGPLLGAMAAAWAIGVVVVTNTLERRLESQLRNAATVLATGRLPYTLELLRRLATLQQADFVLLDRAGEVAVTTSDTVGAAIEAALAQRRLLSTSETRRLEAPVQSMAVYHTIESSQDPRYSAIVAVAPLSDATAAAQRAARWLGLAMLAATALLAAVLLTVVRNITRPLAQLSALADRIAAGEREQRLELPRADEIGALAESLNTMMLRLASYESQLALRSRMSALGEMSARLAHEIRNPLTGLKLHLQLLAERVGACESGRVQRLLTEIERLELLVSSTLLLGGERPLDPVPSRVETLITEVLELMGPSLVHRGIRVDSRCDDQLQANVDRGRVRQALLNLIVNAADAMPQGGALRITAEHDGGASRVLIVVEDSGPGLPEELRTRLRDSSVSTKPFGLGLGIRLCRDVAEAHGGELRMERSPDLGGACFIIALPLAAASSTPGTDH
jgi:signal transduction histidine kinase